MNQNIKLLEDNSIFIGSEKMTALSACIQELNASKIFILLDENTHQHCLSWLITNCPELQEAEILEIESGEESKSLETCAQLWYALTELGADRNSLLVNLGGGVITDLGGFLATTFKRGIPYLHIPTTLLAQIDASIGGKNGLNLGELKNQIGSFSEAVSTFIFPELLNSLEEDQLLSGYGEVLKHALLDSSDLWERLQSIPANEISDDNNLIADLIALKVKVVNQDFKEKGLRKVLNLGHTIGHAIESLHLHHSTPLLHGHAIAYGLVIENLLAQQKHLLDQELCSNINQYILNIYPKIDFSTEDTELILEYLTHDKKNTDQQWNFSLLKEIGEASIDVNIEEKDVREALDRFKNL